MNISIIIPSYKSEKTIDLCLNSVFNQKTDIDYEVIVVDSSPGNTVDQIVKKYKKVKFIKLKKQIFPGIGRNIGAEKAKGEIQLFLDSYMVLNKKAISLIKRYYQRRYKIF